MQVSFTVYPNYTEVSENVDYNVVDEATRFKKSGYQHSNAYKKRAWDGYTRLFNRKTMVFPTGLLERVKRALKKKHKHIKFEIKDLRTFRTGISSIDGVSLNGVTLRKHQVRAANAMLKQKHGCCGQLPTVGKLKWLLQ